MAGNVVIKEVRILSDDTYVLKKITFDRQDKNGKWQTRAREVYDRGNAATILLYNLHKKSVILTRQFRLPSFINGNPTGMLIEACAGLLDGETPEDCIRRESTEETGYKVNQIRKIYEAYMSAGGITELLHFFTGTYSDDNKPGEGGGLKEEQEEIEVLEMSFDEALSMLDRGEIKDGKTIMLLQYARLHGLFESDGADKADTRV